MVWLEHPLVLRLACYDAGVPGLPGLPYYLAGTRFVCLAVILNGGRHWLVSFHRFLANWE
jgi:hypothetical protein